MKTEPQSKLTTEEPKKRLSISKKTPSDETDEV